MGGGRTRSPEAKDSKMSNAYILRKHKSSLTDLTDGGSVYGFPGVYPGRIYYVNNITGAATNDGLSWDTAFDQVDAALLASETFRITHATNNKVLRNIIYVQGTETAYSKVDQDANCFDMVGIGHRKHLGGAAGEVMISGAAAADGMAMTDLLSGWDTTLNKGGGLGCNIYNIHFEASGGAYWAVDLEDFLDSSFEDCTFMCSGATTTGGGLRGSNNFAGSIVRNCHAGGDAGSQTYGFYFTGGVWNQNVIEYCSANSITTGLYVANYLQGGTVVRFNSFYGGTYGINDVSAETTLLGLALYTGNYAGGGTTGIVITNGGTKRAIGNWVTSNGVADWFTTIAKS